MAQTWGADALRDSDGTSPENFLSGMIKSIPPLQDVAGMAGVELPSYLGKMVDVAGDDGPIEETNEPKPPKATGKKS